MPPLMQALLLATLLLAPPFTRGDEAGAARQHDDRIRMTRVVGASVIAAWGLISWDYGERSLHSADEGWFGADSPEGGADKVGHLYSSYVMTRAFAGLYEQWGDSRPSAAREAVITTLLLTGFMELGDGISPYGISHEDMIMNVAGSVIGHQLATREAWARRLDLRMEYAPNRTDDPLTDYQHSRYLVALKLGGFSATEGSPFQWLELHAGYFTRGYHTREAPNRRFSYLGLGINLSALLDRAGWHRSARLLRYYQVPDTSVRAEHEHD